MTRKKTQTQKKTIQNSLQIKIISLENQIKKLHIELKEKNEKYLRICADLQNFQKRTEKELQLKEDEIKKKYIIELLNIYELLQKANQDNNPKEGLKLILNNLEKLLKIEQITYIDCVGKPFDHTVHHAIMSKENDKYEDDTIIEEIQKGYKIGSNLLQPSQVIVSKKKKNHDKNNGGGLVG